MSCPLKPLAVALSVAVFAIALTGAPLATGADEPAVKIADAYGWWNSQREPAGDKMHISEHRIYWEWTNPAYLESPFKMNWTLAEGEFRRLDDERFLFVADRYLGHPQKPSFAPPCRFIEFATRPTDAWRAPKFGLVLIYYENFSDQEGLTDECGGPPIYWPDWQLREHLAKRK